MVKPSTLRIGHRYRDDRLKGPYDTLVIGSGIGGLAALREAGRPEEAMAEVDAFLADASAQAFDTVETIVALVQEIV